MDKDKRRTRRNLTAKHARSFNKAVRFADKRQKIKAGYIKHKGELL